ncbi:MAG: restriction endonuclease subunit S [Polyangiaceae bacterium]|nr:restriction endonuclease subunit S [Polyangiaceae bacterium]
MKNLTPPAPLSLKGRGGSPPQDTPDERELPRGWTIVPFGEIADLSGGITKGQKRKEGTQLRSVPYLRVANVQRGYLDLTEMKYIEATAEEIRDLSLQQGDILLNEGGDKDKLGRGWVWENQEPLCIHQNHVFRARLKLPDFNPYFFSHYLNSHGQQFFESKGKQTTGIASIGMGVIRAVPVLVPPLPEQRRIVAKLDELLARSRKAREALEAIPPLLEKLRQSILAAAFRGDLTASWREKNPDVEPASVLLQRIRAERRKKWEEAELARLTAKGKTPLGDSWKDRYQEPEPVNTEGLPELPEGWCWASLEELADVVGGITKGQSRRPGAKTRTIPYLRVANVQRGYLNLEEIKEIEASEEEIRCLLLRKGDLLLNEGGDRDKLGRGWIWNEEVKECIHQNHVFRARLHLLDIQPEYVSHYANTFGQIFFVDQGKQTTNLASVSISKVKSFPVALPPVQEQQHLVVALQHRLKIVQALQTIQQQAGDEQPKLEQALLAKAFRGELVAQDPADEPAEVMLERLRKEQEQAPAGAGAGGQQAGEEAEGRQNARGEEGEGRAGHAVLNSPGRHDDRGPRPSRTGWRGVFDGAGQHEDLLRDNNGCLHGSPGVILHDLTCTVGHGVSLLEECDEASPFFLVKLVCEVESEIDGGMHFDTVCKTHSVITRLSAQGLRDLHIPREATCIHRGECDLEGLAPGQLDESAGKEEYLGITALIKADKHIMPEATTRFELTDPSVEALLCFVVLELGGETDPTG